MEFTMSLEQLRQDLIISTARPAWELYIDSFPTWTVDSCSWPTTFGIPIKILSETDSSIEIEIHQNDHMKNVFNFLESLYLKWFDPRTNFRGDPKELQLPVTLVDANNECVDRHITLNCPTKFNHNRIAPRIEVLYNNNDD
jgi:hypothetical protein